MEKYANEIMWVMLIAYLAFLIIYRETIKEWARTYKWFKWQWPWKRENEEKKDKKEEQKKEKELSMKELVNKASSTPSSENKTDNTANTPKSEERTVQEVKLESLLNKRIESKMQQQDDVALDALFKVVNQEEEKQEEHLPEDLVGLASGRKEGVYVLDEEINNPLMQVAEGRKVENKINQRKRNKTEKTEQKDNDLWAMIKNKVSTSPEESFYIRQNDYIRREDNDEKNNRLMIQPTMFSEDVDREKEVKIISSSFKERKEKPLFYFKNNENWFEVVDAEKTDMREILDRMAKQWGDVYMIKKNRYNVEQLGSFQTSKMASYLRRTVNFILAQDTDNDQTKRNKWYQETLFFMMFVDNNEIVVQRYFSSVEDKR